jgi:signal transduction histidine kinase
MQTKAVENKLQIDLEISNDLPRFNGDRDKLKQVVLNLISNAINYNKPSGSIAVGAKQDPDELILYVRDTGQGIRQADLSHLFDKFYRSQTTEKAARGTGLGLAISKKIVEAHNGRIEVKSETGIGTTFFIHLPLGTS